MSAPTDEHISDRPSWGSWDDAEQSAHDAFLQRSPADRLAWLEDLLRLRAAVVVARSEDDRATPGP
jgi:hypothetical protein